MPSPYIGCSKQRSLGGVDLISHCCLHEPPASERDLHRPIASTNDLDDILCWREQRSVSRQLVINYNRMKFMLRPNKTSAAVAGKLVDIYDFPDGRLEIRWKGLPLPYSVFDQLQRVSHAAIIENKRLGEGLAWTKQQQDKQPHHRGDLVGPRRSNQKAGLMKDRVDRLAQGPKSQPRPARLGRRRCDSAVSAAPAQAASATAQRAVNFAEQKTTTL